MKALLWVCLTAFAATTLQAQTPSETTQSDAQCRTTMLDYASVMQFGETCSNHRVLDEHQDLRELIQKSDFFPTLERTLLECESLFERMQPNDWEEIETAWQKKSEVIGASQMAGHEEPNARGPQSPQQVDAFCNAYVPEVRRIILKYDPASSANQAD